MLESHLDPLKVGVWLDWDPKIGFALNYFNITKKKKLKITIRKPLFSQNELQNHNINFNEFHLFLHDHMTFLRALSQQDLVSLRS